MTDTRQKAEKDLHRILQEGGVTPEELLVKVMYGQETVTVNGKTKKITATMIAVARDFLPYRLPKLNSIDAQIKNVNMTTEEWLKAMDEEESQGGDPSPET